MSEAQDKPKRGKFDPMPGGMLGDVGQEYPEFLMDESRLHGEAASISFPRDETELREQLESVRDSGLSVTLQGMKTGITGAASPRGGHILNLSRMNRILGLRYDDRRDVFLLRLHPGVLMREQIWPATWQKEIDSRGWSAESLEALELYRAKGGYFFPPDPSEPTIAIGGMASNNSWGARSFLYGPVRDYIEALKVILFDGSTLDLVRGRARARGRSFALATHNGRAIRGELPGYSMPAVKHSAGYYVRDDMDLIDLFIGAEGTLGILAEVEVRLVPSPGAMWGVMSFLPAEKAAIEFAREVRITGARPAAIEFLDSHSLDTIRAHRERFEQYQLAPEIPRSWHTAVYVEYHARDEDEAEAAVLEMSRVLARCGGDIEATWSGTGEREIQKFKQIRHLLPEIVNSAIAERQRSEPRITKLATDLAVPDDRFDELLSMYQAGLHDGGFEHLMFGHIGDNNLHVNIIPRTYAEYESGMALYREWARAAVQMGGTVAAEHGIGKLKRELLRDMYGDAEIGRMAELKRLFDPDFRLNPGNMFCVDRGAG